MRLLAFVAFLVAAVLSPAFAKDPADCEVCIAAMQKVADKVKEKKLKDLVAIEEVIGGYCEKPANEKETKLCYYIDPIKREVSQPMKNGVPVATICQRLKKKSAEICALKFSSGPSSSTVTADSDFSKMKISQLKTIMADKNIVCDDCIEKNDYIKKIKATLSAKKEL